MGLSNKLSPVLSDTPKASSGRLRALGEFLAIGGLTPFLFPLSLGLQKLFGLDSSELAVGFVMFHAAFVINDPHFAVTYLLFYKDIRARALCNRWSTPQKIRYLLAGFFVPLILAAWGISAIASTSPHLLGLMIQLMFLLVGWHYVKQGFGVFSVLCARRGIVFGALERWAVLAHCYAGWAYAWASPMDPGRLLEEKGLVYMSLSHPPGLERITQMVFFATTLPLAWVLARKWRQHKNPALITPLIALLCSVWAWSIYSGIDPLVKYMVPALHSIQYLYFVWILKGNEARERQGPPWFERSADMKLIRLAISAIGLAWILFHGIPGMLDGIFVSRKAIPEFGSLGPTPYFAAIYAFVNMHHYFMDTVIWRRENPDTRYLREPGPAKIESEGI